jgi:ABC-type polysaccharide/polyol phosphate transport system ATPase subunit
VNATIQAANVGVRFLFDRERRLVTPALARLRRRGSEVWGIKSLDFTIGPGESVALLGPSGAGKTTLLRSVAGVFACDEGTLSVRGRVAPLLSVDAGLINVLTGRESALLLSVLAGLPLGRARNTLESVKRESGLGDAFERPVQSYSEGMRARLGYTVVNETQPNIMLLDEVHESLDHEFREAVEHRARVILERGGIVIAAGHDHGLLERLCGRAFLLKGGRLVHDGPFAETQQSYLSGQASSN